MGYIYIYTYTALMRGSLVPMDVVEIILEYVGYTPCHVCKRPIKCTEDRYMVWTYNFCSQICYFHV